MIDRIGVRAINELLDAHPYSSFRLLKHHDSYYDLIDTAEDDSVVQSFRSPDEAATWVSGYCAGHVDGMAVFTDGPKKATD